MKENLRIKKIRNAPVQSLEILGRQSLKKRTKKPLEEN